MTGPDFPDNPSRDDLERISRWAGVPLRALVPLSHDVDPFLAGTEAHVADAERFMSLIEFLQVTTGTNPDDHLRDLHYLLLSTDAPYLASEWEWLVKAAGRARDLGLIEPWAFPDKRTQALLLSKRGEGEEIEYTITKPTFHVPIRAWISEVEVEGFSALKAQPVRVLVLIEKDSDKLRAEVVGPCMDAGAELRVTTGFSPKTLAARLAQEATYDTRPLVVFQITDADSAGEHMSVVTGRHLEMLSRRYDLPPIYLDRIALTLAQVKEIEELIGKPIPLAPDEYKDGTLKRKEGRVELNALPTFAPGWLYRQVRRALASVTVEIEEPEVDVPDDLQDALRQAGHITRRLYRRIEDKLRWVEEIVDAALDEWEPDDPEVDVPEIDLARDWILDTGRDYLTQLNAYRRHGAAHRDTEPLVLTERLCDCGCGESLRDMRVQARYLTPAHRQRKVRRP